VIEPGQTLIFLGDHTSPDDPGYVSIVREVLSRFYPQLQSNLISAGSRGQTASGLRRSELMQLVTSSKPDWLVIGIGLGDAMREPSARRLLDEYRKLQAEKESDEAEMTFGPEYQVRRMRNVQGSLQGEFGMRNGGEDDSPHSEGSDLQLFNLDAFKADLAAALSDLQAAGVHCAVLTTIVVGNDLQNPVNSVLRLYNRAIREATSEHDALLVDVERAFRDVFDRAANYKQKLALTGPTGDLNAQGQALVVRTFLAAFGMLPHR
jgi:lysophospholipase L1-like esterase